VKADPTEVDLLVEIRDLLKAGNVDRPRPPPH